MSASRREQTPELEMYLFNRMSSDFNGFGMLLTGFADFFDVAESIVGFTFFGPCPRFGMAGFGLFELGRELFGRELFRLLLPSLLFINSVI
jgi:hypothetical protein